MTAPIVKPITDFTSLYPKQTTVKSYTSCLCRFLESVNGIEKPAPNTKVDFPKYESLASDYLDQVLKKERNPRNDLIRFVSSLSTQSPVTQRKYPSHVCMWLEFHGVSITSPDKRMIFRRMRPNVPASEDEEFIDHEKIRRILQFSPPQLAALIHVLASTGCRLNEVLQLHMDDIYMDEDPVRIRLRPETTKTGLGRTVFISAECKPILEEWLRFRPEYIENKRGPNEYRTGEDDGRVFPFNDSNALSMWTHALDRAGLLKRDSATNRLTLHPHSLRKFYRRFLPTGSNNPKAVELCEKLMGHAGYLQGVYSKVPVSELAAFYSEAEQAIWINQAVRVNVQEFQRLQSENEEMKVKVDNLLKSVGILGELVREKSGLSPL